MYWMKKNIKRERNNNIILYDEPTLPEPLYETITPTSAEEHKVIVARLTDDISLSSNECYEKQVMNKPKTYFEMTSNPIYLLK